MQTVTSSLQGGAWRGAMRVFNRVIHKSRGNSQIFAVVRQARSQRCSSESGVDRPLCPECRPARSGDAPRAASRRAFRRRRHVAPTVAATAAERVRTHGPRRAGLSVAPAAPSRAPRAPRTAGHVRQTRGLRTRRHVAADHGGGRRRFRARTARHARPSVALVCAANPATRKTFAPRGWGRRRHPGQRSGTAGK